MHVCKPTHAIATRRFCPVLNDFLDVTLPNADGLATVPQGIQQRWCRHSLESCCQIDHAHKHAAKQCKLCCRSVSSLDIGSFLI